MQLQHDVVCPALVGRAPQLAAIHDLLAHAREGSGRVALVVGEAGVGKSRLLRAMADEARAAGFFVLQGACFEAERSIPYAPLLDLVRLLAGSTSPALLAHLLAPAASELVTMFPELRPLLPDASPLQALDPESDRRRLFHALAQALAALARTQPVLLAFEDVHWSDDATLELVFHLARSLAAQPVAMALTLRGEEIGPRLGRLISDLERARLVAELPVQRLGREDVGEMLQAIFGERAGPGGEFLQVLHALTEGNPFFVEETLKALILVGDLAPAAGGGWRARPLERVRVPRTAVEAVRRRLASLSEPARELASTAAVAGRRFDFDFLQTLTDHDERALLSLVKELIAAQLVVEETADRFAFRHALTREAIYDELLARERVALHRQVAAALERRHADAPDAVVESLAYHAWEAGDWERAADHAARAARHALALSAPREALAHLDRAFAALERSARTPDAPLLITRGRTCETLGEFQRANDDFSAALELARAAGDRLAEWQALYALGMLWAARDYARAGAWRREALELSRTLGDESLVARSLNRVGNWHVNLDEPHAGLPHHEEALAIFERSGDRRGIAETVDLIGMAHHIAGEQREAARHFERAAPLFSALDDRRGRANALGLLALSGGSYHVDATTPLRTEGADGELRDPQSIRLARDIGWRAGEAFLHFILADSLGWRGEYDRAVPIAGESLALARELQHLEWTAAAHKVMGALSLDLLAPELARTHLESAYQVACRTGSRVWIRWTAAPLAVARAWTGDLAGAHEVLDDAERAAGDDGDSLTLGERQLRIARAEVALAERRPEAALEIATARLDAERRANGDVPFGAPRLTLLRAQALLALGRLDEAEAALGVARAEAEAQGARPMRWRIEAALGHVHRARRERLEARRAFDSARSIAGELAALVPDGELRARFLEEIDARIPAAPPASPARAAKEAFGGLTRRERDVAELVARGKANRAIARHLGIGERTVEGYVAGALGKLGFTSRTQLAAWAVAVGMGNGESGMVSGAIRSAAPLRSSGRG